MSLTPFKTYLTGFTQGTPALGDLSNRKTFHTSLKNHTEQNQVKTKPIEIITGRSIIPKVTIEHEFQYFSLIQQEVSPLLFTFFQPEIVQVQNPEFQDDFYKVDQEIDQYLSTNTRARSPIIQIR